MSDTGGRSDHDLSLVVQQAAYVAERTAMTGPTTVQEAHQIQQGRWASDELKRRR